MIWNFLGSEHAWFHYGLLRGAEGWFCFHHHVQSLGEGGEGWFHSTCNTFLLQLPRCSWCYALLFLQELAIHSWWWALCFLLELPKRSWCYPSNFLSELPAGSGCYARNFLLELWTLSYLKKTSQTIPSHRRCAKLNNIYNNFGFGSAATPGSKMHQEAKILSCRSPCCPRCFGPTPNPRTAPATLHSPNQNWCPKVSTLPCWWFFQSCAAPNFFQHIDLRLFMRSFPSEVTIVDAWRNCWVYDLSHEQRSLTCNSTDPSFHRPKQDETTNRIPVVPRKAVAEVSKIGNL